MQFTVHDVHTIILGSGAAGLNAAVQLKRRGIDDLLILTEGLDRGTSINTGSDKQTYYKLGLYGGGSDSPREMAETLFAGGATDGDTALVEAALSPRGFYNLLELGVPFPQDAFGQFPGYKTDHDPRQRATSIGPYTSRDMCRALIAEVRRLRIPTREHRVAIRLTTINATENKRRIAGVFCIDTAAPLETCLEFYRCENLVFATGGPGGLYRDSVYPAVHTGGIGLALEIGATAQSLPESQFGLASTAFRWNVSGTYMQVIPRLISTAKDGSDEREFLDEYYRSPAEKFAAVFLKGYQWPLDVRKITGSSLIDLLVYRETVERGRRVFLDYRNNPPQLDFAALPTEVRDYLEKSRATFGKPIDRLRVMNPQAIELYADNGIDLSAEPLEIALCAQHNNGGLSVNRFWESVNIARLFVAGEVAGTHGIARPGGSALNAGQVAGFRIAELIAGKYRAKKSDRPAAIAFARSMAETFDQAAIADEPVERRELQARMSNAAGPIVTPETLQSAGRDAFAQADRLIRTRERPRDARHLAESFRTRSLAYAAAVYIGAVNENLAVGSRGSRLVLDAAGEPTHPALGWRYLPERGNYRASILETRPPSETSPKPDSIDYLMRPCRPLPECDAWFETAWADYREGRHFDTP